MRVCFIICLFAVCGSLDVFADAQADLEKELKSASQASEEWLAGVDKGDYGKSWDEGSPILQLTVPKQEWVSYVQLIRKPLGKVVKRTELQQRTASNPPRMPKGDYVVEIYNSEYANKKEVVEFVILSYTPEGRWRVMAYELK